MENMKVSKEQRNKGRRDFLLLVAVFFLPIILVLVVYFNFENWGLGAGRNHGNLFQPPRELQDVMLTDVQGEAFRFSDLRDKWLMVRFGSATCDDECQRELYLMRQIRLAQGGDRHRIRRIHISIDGPPGESLLKQLDEHPDLQIVYGDTQGLQQVMNQFRHDTGSGNDIQEMYLVDPRGFLMMSYPQGFDAKGAIKDLERLLKFARSG